MRERRVSECTRRGETEIKGLGLEETWDLIAETTGVGRASALSR